MSLFAAAIGKDAATLGPVVVLAEFNDDFTDLFTSSTVAERGLGWNNHLATKALIRQQSPFDLDRRTLLPFFTQLCAQVQLTMEWKETPMSTDIRYVSSQLTIYNYLAPPRDPDSASSRAYAQAMDKSNISRVEDQIEEAASKRTKMQVTSFLLGRQSSPADIAAAISNLITDLSFRFNLPTEISQGPTIRTSFLNKDDNSKFVSTKSTCTFGQELTH